MAGNERVYVRRSEARLFLKEVCWELHSQSSNFFEFLGFLNDERVLMLLHRKNALPVELALLAIWKCD